MALITILGLLFTSIESLNAGRGIFCNSAAPLQEHIEAKGAL